MNASQRQILHNVLGFYQARDQAGRNQNASTLIDFFYDNPPTETGEGVGEFLDRLITHRIGVNTLLTFLELYKDKNYLGDSNKSHENTSTTKG